MNSKFILKIFVPVFIISFILIVSIVYSSFFMPNLNINGNKKQFVFVYPNQTWNDVAETLDEMQLLRSKTSFKMAIYLKHGKTPPQSGKYDIEPNLTNRYLLNRITHGLQSRILLRLVSARRTEKVASNLSKQLMIDSTTLIQQFHHPDILERYNLIKANSLCLFLPFRSEVNWDIDVEAVMNLIEKEYNDFWNDDRKKKAKNINLSLAQIHILASIVEEESNDNEDKKMVAGVYLNRLKRGMLLQADPTVRYAVGDFNINRILKRHLTIDSPYNTYLYAGLPPSPIRIPTKESIDAVLNYKKHNFLYMVAKADFSGKHDFSVTYEEHMRKARAYQRQLNKRGIFN